MFVNLNVPFQFKLIIFSSSYIFACMAIRSSTHKYVLRPITSSK